MSNLIKEIEYEKGRVFVCPDLHGSYDKLFAKLDSVNFDYDEDIVIGLGDLVDRGPNSLDCFNLIYKTWFYSIRGNHEQFCLDYTTANQEYLRELRDRHERNGGEWFYRLPKDTQQKIGEAIDNLPIVLVLNRNGKRYGFIHGDIPYYVRSYDDIVTTLSGKNADEHASEYLWSRSRMRMNIHDPERAAHIEGFERIYLGHTVIKEPINIKNTRFLDCGAVFDHPYGNLYLEELL